MKNLGISRRCSWDIHFQIAIQSELQTYLCLENCISVTSYSRRLAGHSYTEQLAWELDFTSN